MNTNHKQVANFDFVKPTPRGYSWNVGGTCVNVGCVPKKIMHAAASYRENVSEARNLGWTTKVDDFTWSDLVKTTTNHVKSTSFSYSNALRSADVEYINAEARLSGANTVIYDAPVSFLSEEVTTKEITAKYIIIAVGSRPHVMNTEWYEHFDRVITSDDLFWTTSNPGKTLVVGAGYVALESASFLNAFGFDTTVCVRSHVLRGFDEDCANRVQDLMKGSGVRFMQGLEPSNIEKDEQQLRVSFNDDSDELFDTVMLATGRRPRTFDLGLETLGTKPESTGHLVTDDEDRVVGDVYAIGDVVSGSPELTPYAIKQGENLVQRLFDDKVVTPLNKFFVATTIFTSPSEYSCVGKTELDATREYGSNHVNTYLWSWTTLEKEASGYDMDTPNCFGKIVCTGEEDRVVGMHFVGPNAGELMQGFALAIKAGVTKSDFDDLVGIHPTDAEAFVQMSVERRDVSEEADFTASGGCGGGKCG